ncbi:MAG: UDP-N-acetylglucosamine 1-carboxyvinyltransferase [Candidatus Spechtbacterales bacterium]
MDSFVINGGNELKGEITVKGSKNAATKLIAATLLTEETCTLIGLPDIADVSVMLEILEEMGATLEREGEETRITNADIDPKKLPHDKVRKLRSSIVLAGPLLARFGEVTLAYPGGDKIGARPVDTHLHAFADLGCDVSKREDTFTIRAPKEGAAAEKVVLDEFSVTATENIMMFAASRARPLHIAVAANEPHIQDLALFLSQMGAQVELLPFHRIVVTGVDSRAGARHAVRPDYIEAGTFVAAVLAIGGDVRIANFPTEDLELFLHALVQRGANITVENARTVRVQTSPNLALGRIQTMIYPGIPTDLQAPLGVLATQSNGTTFIHDPMYEGRLRYLSVLADMGATVNMLDVHRAEVTGPTKLKGIDVHGEDIRSAMSFIIAGLAAEGTTTIHDAYPVERGYEAIDERLRALGADIQRVSE